MSNRQQYYFINTVYVPYYFLKPIHYFYCRLSSVKCITVCFPPFSVCILPFNLSGVSINIFNMVLMDFGGQLVEGDDL